MLCLIDSDIVAYRCAASAENEDQEVAEVRVNDLMQRILYETNSSDYIGFLSGSDNFRYELYPQYKANRKDKPRPKHLDACKELLITQWKCKVTDGIEADDALGIEHQTEPDSILASIDKDFLQLPGNHFQWEISGTSSLGKKWTKPTWRGVISPIQGLRNFYTQLIEGDATDNIPAFDGKLRSTRPKFVQKLINPLDDLMYDFEMYDYVAGLYSEQVSWADDWESILHRNAHLLYIQKKEGDKWSVPTTMEDGPQEDSVDLFEQLSAVPRNDGLQNMKF